MITTNQKFEKRVLKIFENDHITFHKILETECIIFHKILENEYILLAKQPGALSQLIWETAAFGGVSAEEKVGVLQN